MPATTDDTGRRTRAMTTVMVCVPILDRMVIAIHSGLRGTEALMAPAIAPVGPRKVDTHHTAVAQVDDHRHSGVDTLNAGTRLGDRYVLLESIARGGMGEVWRPDDTVLGREAYRGFIARCYATRGTRWRMLPAAANGLPAVASYVPDSDGDYHLHSLQVFIVAATASSGRPSMWIKRSSQPSA